MTLKRPTPAQILDRAMSKMADFKAREGRIAIGLKAVQTALKRDDAVNALMFIEAMLTEDLGKSLDWHQNRAFALSIAVKAMQDHDLDRAQWGPESGSDKFCQHGSFTDSLSHIEILAPEAFVKEASPK